MKPLFSARPISVQTFPLAAALFISLSGLALAQQSVSLDGTSGSESSSANYSTNGGLNISLDFKAEYLIVAGGGSGGTPGGSGGQNTWGAGGGGGGGMLTGNRTLTNTSYNVTVGAGGVAPNYSASSTTRGSNGGNSAFGDISALGGGGGGGGENSFSGVGADGGSGGGGGSKYSNAGGSGTSGQGFSGGNARNGDTSSAGDRTAGGGGGGAGGAGSTPASGSSTAGNGGVGRASDITGTSVTYAGGGGGGARDIWGGQNAGSGGSGGGGAGSTQSAATSGTDGLGGGGGGAGADGKGGDGGDGIIIVRYKGSSLGSIGGNVTSGTGTAAGYTLHTFTTTGSSSLNLSAVNMNARLGTTLSGTISGNGRLTFNGPGTLNLTGNNTYTGGTTVNSGRLIGSVNSIRGDITNNSQLEFNQVSNASYISNISGNGSFTKTGAGHLTLSGINTYTGGTTINSGRLIGNVDGLQGNITNNSQLEFNQSSNASYSSNISGNGSLTKTGEGKLILSGSNSYTGATAVNNGSLAVNGSLGSTSVTVGESGAGTWVSDEFTAEFGPYWVPTLATLQGSGSIGGAVTITSNGILSAGNSIESLAMGSLTLQSGSDYIQEVDSSATVGTQADLVVVNGNLNIGSFASLTLTDLAGSWNWVNDTKLTMINYSGTWDGGLFYYSYNGIDSWAMEDDSVIDMGGGKGWIINYNDTTGGANYSSEQTLSKFVTLTAVPEPTVVTLGGLGALLLLRRRRA